VAYLGKCFVLDVRYTIECYSNSNPMTDAPLKRSILATPATDAELLRVAARSNADEVLLDLEDSLAPREKSSARDGLVEMVREHDWSDQRLSYRINAVRTQWWYEDVISVLEQSGSLIDDVVVPKVESEFDVRTVDNLIDSIAANTGQDLSQVGIVAQVETAAGVANVEDIVHGSERLNTLLFGPGDYIASLGRESGISVDESTYEGHYWHYPLSRISQAAASEDLLAVDGPYTRYKDIDGFERSCQHASMLGFAGKITVHPTQVEPANDVFSLSSEEIEQAREIVSAYERADGIATIDGLLVDDETYEIARRLLARAEKEKSRR